ncbi:MAG: hypothetical protein ACYCYO_00345 [Bacilli bacterium]
MAKDNEYAKREVSHWNNQAVRLREARESYGERAARFSRPNLVGSDPKKSATSVCTWIAGDADCLLFEIKFELYERATSDEEDSHVSSPRPRAHAMERAKDSSKIVHPRHTIPLQSR